MLLVDLKRIKDCNRETLTSYEEFILKESTNIAKFHLTIDSVWLYSLKWIKQGKMSWMQLDTDP